MTRRDLGSSSSELSGISIAFSGDDAGGGLSPSSSELSELSGISIAFAGHDIVMACVRRLAGDGVYWDRLRVSGRVRGATCAAPRKNRRRRSRRSRRAAPQTSPPHATRLRALGRRHSLLGRAAPPRRAPPCTGAAGSPMALFPVAAPRGARSRSATARAVDRSISTRSALFQGVVSLGGPEDGKAETVTKKSRW